MERAPKGDKVKKNLIDLTRTHGEKERGVGDDSDDDESDEHSGPLTARLSTPNIQ